MTTAAPGPELDPIRIEEYRFLRQELEANRSYVFERPLLIVGATLAGTVSLDAKAFLELILIPFLALLLFNLWFTANRLKSSGRIVGYIQLVHEGSRMDDWVGWENALQAYREWRYSVLHAPKSPPDDEASPPNDGDGPRPHHGLAYYPAIFNFHLVVGILVTVMILVQAGIGPEVVPAGADLAHQILRVANLVALLCFPFTLVPFRPDRLRHDIDEQREMWNDVFTSYLHLAVPPKLADRGPRERSPALRGVGPAGIR